MRFIAFRTVYKLEFDKIESDTGNLKHEKNIFIILPNLERIRYLYLHAMKNFKAFRYRKDKAFLHGIG